MKDTDFVPIPVERETYDCPPPKPQPRPRLFAELSSLSLAGLAQMLLKVSRIKPGQRNFAKVRDLTDVLLLQKHSVISNTAVTRQDILKIFRFSFRKWAKINTYNHSNGK